MSQGKQSHGWKEAEEDMGCERGMSKSQVSNPLSRRYQCLPVSGEKDQEDAGPVPTREFLCQMRLRQPGSLTKLAALQGDWESAGQQQAHLGLLCQSSCMGET